jgi:gliding motility-associated-like protein
MTSILQYFVKRIKYTCCFIEFLLPISMINCYGITAKFSIEMKSICAPAVAIFTNLSSQGNGITYKWNFGNGAISYSSDQALEEAYSNPGHYVITLTVIKGSERDSVSDSIDVSIGPKASFSVDATQGCNPLQVHFTNTSTGAININDVLWDFRNGDIRKGNNVSYTYAQPGNYDVLLTVTDGNGCKDYIESKNLIKVVQKPVADFSVSDSFACRPPLNVTFINKSTGQPGLKYLWDFGNGTQSSETNASVAYTRIRNYDVKLVVTDIFNCKDSLTKLSLINIGNGTGKIYAKKEDGSLIQTAIICPGKITFGFTLANRSDYTWTVLYKNSTLYFYNKNEFTLQVDSGNITIKLVYGLLSDCPDSIRTTFLVDYVKADFSIDKSFGCSLPHQINLQNQSINASAYNWKLYGGSVSHDLNTADVIPWHSNYNLVYSHKAIHSEYNYSLTVITSNGCEDSTSKIVNIDLPVARFMPDEVKGCVPLQVTFSDSSDSNLPITKWEYKIGDLSIVSESSNPFSYTFKTPGEFKTMLIITTNQGCIDTSYNIMIEAGEQLFPDFSVSPSSVCYGETLKLSGLSNLKDSIDFWRYSCEGVFNVGSNKNSDTIIIIKTDTSGSKNVKLEVDYNGCVSEAFKINAFEVKGPVGNFFESFKCDSPLYYTFASKILPATSLEWLVDTSTINDKDTITYLFPRSGDFNVKLIVNDNASLCTLTKNKIITVRQVKANFNIDPFYCLGDTTIFNAGNSIDPINHCYMEGFLWDFNDYSPRRRSYNPKYIYTYKDTGNYRPLLTVIDDNGCTDTISRKVKIAKPDLSFSIDKNKGCVPKIDVNFTYYSIDTTVIKWSWDFGDGSSNMNSISIKHTYVSNLSRNYTATLSVKDYYGCIASMSRMISLIKTSADFQAIDNALCIGEEANFLITADTIGSYTWYFGDGETSNSTNSHIYNNTGLFDVTLEAHAGSCSNTVTKKQYISVEKADAQFSVSESNFKCYPATVLFNHTGSSSAIARGIWDFGNGSQSNTYSASPQYTYTRPGNFRASLWIRTLNNCQSSASRNIVITGPSATFTFTPKRICYGDSVNFSMGQTQNVNESKWLFGDGEISNLPSPTHKYYARGIIVPALWLKNDECETSINNGNLIISAPTANFDFSGGKSAICLGEKLNATNTSQEFVWSVWKINETINSTTTNLKDASLNNAGNYTVKLIVKDFYSCYDSISKIAAVVPLPSFQISGDTSICKGTGSTQLVIQSDPAWRVHWSPASGLSDTTSFSPIATPEASTQYTAFVSDTNGCTAGNDITIFVKQPSSITFYPVGDTSINIGEKIQLKVFTGDNNTNYQWSPNYSISCRNCSNPFVAPEKDYTYKVIIKDKCYETTKEFNIHVIINFFLEAPKAFRPNSDVTENKVFKFESDNIKSFELKIFNRWGNLIFTSNSPDKGWDGAYNGKLQNIDTYTFFLKAETGSGYKFERKGAFLLLK